MYSNSCYRECASIGQYLYTLIVSQIVHATYPNMCIKDGDGKTIMKGGSNALVKWSGDAGSNLEFK